jgi:sialate O-acetylesterase
MTARREGSLASPLASAAITRGKESIFVPMMKLFHLLEFKYVPVSRVFICWMLGVSFFGVGQLNVALASIIPGPLFCDHAVLQRDKPVPVWGFATPGEKIVVSHRGHVVTANANAEGRWIATLPAMAASAVGADLTIAGDETVTLRDVLVGEVWLCSGQSNMAWNVARSANAEQEIAAANFPLLRHIKIQGRSSAEPQSTVKTSGWEPTTPATVGAFSAVGYFFGRHLQRELGVPVGLVNSCWSGSQIEAWMSREVLDRESAFEVVAKRWNEVLAEYPEKKAEYDQRMAEWEKIETAAKAANPNATEMKRVGRPEVPLGPGHYNAPTGLYNGMIHPLLPLALRGTIWYQGEGNAARAAEYAGLFKALIQSWRAEFRQGDFPFYWVQLANRYHRRPIWTELRAAQTETLAVANTGQAVTIDIGERDQTHARNKQDVGRRLALIALAKTYGRDIEYSGPMFTGVEREGTALRVRFTHAMGGLIARGGAMASLEVAGDDGNYVPAAGHIDGETLLVSAPGVEDPVAVRYAWAENPSSNLYNTAGLPAAPFRSKKP